ncbi:IS3 family transposase [Pseudoalteromonas sp. ND6B]|uniref:IS3 family transposase n=2 Tax=unclassified Pseudoalteromonas TaxID=194690 RepID=UPI001269D582|nr:IS3 family transposase [Pseudoalteromonas sp. ND6B]
MRRRFTQEFKVQAVEKALSQCDDVRLEDIADDLGVGYSTLQRWIALAKKHQLETHQTGSQMTAEKRPQDWSLEERLSAIIDCGHLDETAINEYCRNKGLYPHHIKQWKQDFAQGPTTKLVKSDSKQLKQEIKQLQKELNRKDKALAETAALLVLKKKADAPLGFQRGRLTTLAERHELIKLITNAQDSGARKEKACELLGLTARTVQRWIEADNMTDKRTSTIKRPPNRLTELERQRIINTVNSTEYGHLPASKIVPKLLDNGIWIASESSFYRVMKAHNLLTHREKVKPAKPMKKPRALKAVRANEVYTWDITYLPTSVKGQFLYLYLVMDIFSRKVVGWQVHDTQLSELAADLMKDICSREQIKREQVTLHSDNGSPMKGATLLATLQELGIVPSFSRPSVSNDNPYSESLFKTLKYRPEYPEKAFEDISAAREWVSGFVDWYNNEHLHSGIKFVTPNQRHSGLDKEILAKRQQVNDAAKLNNPSRWSGKSRDWSMINEINLNPEKKEEMRAA